MWRSTKKYGHNLGYSCCFRQWRADHSHCRFLHGYSLSFEFVFEGDKLDDKNWVMDFGGLSFLKEYLKSSFDHTTLIAQDDPDLEIFMALEAQGLIQLKTLEHVGCEKFSQHLFSFVKHWLYETGKKDIRILSVTVSEHEANSATYLES